MKYVLTAACVLSMLTSVQLAAQTAAPAEPEAAEAAIVRPDDTEGKALPSDGLAECAAILAVATTRAQNIVERKHLENASASWFAASGDLAIAEGALPDAEVWGQKVENWAGRIGSIDAMSQHGDWMTYCAGVGTERGLDTGHFSKHAL